MLVDICNISHSVTRSEKGPNSDMCDWTKANYEDINKYSKKLSLLLTKVSVNNDVVYCSEVCCKTETHISYINSMCNEIPYSAEYTRRSEHQKIQRGACIQV